MEVAYWRVPSSLYRRGWAAAPPPPERISWLQVQTQEAPEVGWGQGEEGEGGQAGRATLWQKEV